MTASILLLNALFLAVVALAAFGLASSFEAPKPKLVPVRSRWRRQR